MFVSFVCQLFWNSKYNKTSNKPGPQMSNTATVWNWIHAMRWTTKTGFVKFHFSWISATQQRFGKVTFDSLVAPETSRTTAAQTLYKLLGEDFKTIKPIYEGWEWCTDLLIYFNKNETHSHVLHLFPAPFWIALKGIEMSYKSYAQLWSDFFFYLHRNVKWHIDGNN